MKKTISAFVFCSMTLASGGLLAEEAPAITEQQNDPAAQAPQTGVVILEPGEGETFTVDQDGKIYQRRGYRGVVPGVRDTADFPETAPAPVDVDAEVPVVVKWVGFQPYETYSRVFIQVTGEFEFSVTRSDPTTVEVALPGAIPGSENDLNGLITRWFPTNVDRIEVRQMPRTDPADQGGLTVIIHLKKATGYLYRQEGNYVFVDVEK